MLEGGSDVPAVWLERADAHARLGHTQLALEDLERVLALDPRRPAEWGGVLKVLRDLPENEPVKDFESRALSRWLVTTGDVSDTGNPVLVECAARCGASQRWDQAAELLRMAPTDLGSDLDYNSVSGKYAICLLGKGDLAAYRAFQGAAIRAVCRWEAPGVPARLFVGLRAGTGRCGRPRRPGSVGRDLSEEFCGRADQGSVPAQPSGLRSIAPAGSTSASPALTKASGCAMAKARPGTGHSWRWPTHRRAGGPRP